ncbi:MAG: DUF4012 domain-containing protein [Actinomycetota bacterium]
MKLRTRILLCLGALGFVALGLSAFLALEVAPELLGARRVLGGSVTELSTEDLLTARAHLENAQGALDSGAASALRLLPVARQNVDAFARVSDSLTEVVDAGLMMRARTDEFEGDPLFAGGSVDMDALSSLDESLSLQARALGGLEQSLRDGRNGWLLPPLWGIFDSSLRRVEPLAAAARNGGLAVDLAEPLLGVPEPRTYLVVLLNNAELRGAGGLPSGAGILTASDGRIELGDFHRAKFMRGGAPYEKVPAPADLTRRWGRYAADTTMWVNSTMSPDSTEVAPVVAAIARKRTGHRFDGVVFADPTGLTALVSPNAELNAPGGLAVRGRDLGSYVMSDAYEELGDVPRERKETLVDLGRSAFAAAVERGYSSVRQLDRIGHALRGGHLRLVSFDPEEQRSLDRLDVGGRLSAPAGDGVLVTAQNTGADKLDYWARRSIDHRCSIEDTMAACATTVTLANAAPRGLSRYVANEPYGLLQNYLEVYVPARAEITGVRRDAQPAEIRRENHSGYTSVGVAVELPRSKRTILTVTYELPIEGRYSLALIPQPLAHDAHLSVRLDAPEGWVVRGPGGDAVEPSGYRGALSGTARFSASPEARPGLSGAWTRIGSFLNEPLRFGT